MKTEIHITGQIMGNSRLRNAIITAEAQERRVCNDYYITFRTKESAVNALSEAYQYMCREMPEEKGKMSGIRYTRGHSLSYDASRAVILDNK
jgi:hypothetical protein